MAANERPPAAPAPLDLDAIERQFQNAMAAFNETGTSPAAYWAYHHGAPLIEIARAAPRALEGPRFSDVNLARCTGADGFGHALESWSIAEWTNAAAGELGEACNLAKKLLRHRDGVAGNKKPEDKDPASLRERCAEELADVVIYADLAMQALGYDLNDTVRRVFNRKSEELNAPYRVTEGPLGGVSCALPEPTERTAIGRAVDLSVDLQRIWERDQQGKP